MAGVQPCNGTTLAVGSLPHREVDTAMALALRATGIPTVPSLPRRSPVQSLGMQAMVGIQGVTVGQYGAVAVDVASIDPEAPVVTDLTHDAFEGFRAFLAAAPGAQPLPELVKWQLVGPLTLGAALGRAGVPLEVAFEVAGRAVRAHVHHLLDVVEQALPGCRQLVFVDEAVLSQVTEPWFPVAPDAAIDLVSGALAAIEARAVPGLHVCGEADWASVIATGPQILGVGLHPSLVGAAGHVTRFLERGGLVAWGAVNTGGPIATSAERPWRDLTNLWCRLVEQGCDQVQIRQQSLITPECGLGAHSPVVAERVLRITGEISRRVRDQATASRFVLGA